MSHNAWRTFRTIVRYAFYAGCVVVIALPLLISASFLVNPFAGFAGASEFTELSGSVAKRRLPNWPVGVNPAQIQNVSYKREYSRDSYSSWYRIQLGRDAASTWMNHVHQHQENSSKRCLHGLHEKLEGVHRIILGPPPQHPQTGETPAWWMPPSIDFRSTEVMLWYSNYDSGVGRATYSGFDESTGTLWIYDYASQHDILWPHGIVPAGNEFSNFKE